MKQNPIKVMVFGVFDGLHAGHKFFLHEAEIYGDELIIVVTPDDVVKKLKEESPIHPMPVRIEELEKEFPKAMVIPGDNRQNSWHVITTHNPDVVVLGYDQDRLRKSLFDMQLKMEFELKVMSKNHKGKTLHSSLLRKKV